MNITSDRFAVLLTGFKPRHHSYDPHCFCVEQWVNTPRHLNFADRTIRFDNEGDVHHSLDPTGFGAVRIVNVLPKNAEQGIVTADEFRHDLTMGIDRIRTWLLGGCT